MFEDESLAKQLTELRANIIKKRDDQQLQERKLKIDKHKESIKTEINNTITVIDNYDKLVKEINQKCNKFESMNIKKLIKPNLCYNPDYNSHFDKLKNESERLKSAQSFDYDKNIFWPIEYNTELKYLNTEISRLDTALSALETSAEK